MKVFGLLPGESFFDDLARHLFDEVNPDVVYVMAEMRQETDYVKHHIQK